MVLPGEEESIKIQKKISRIRDTGAEHWKLSGYLSGKGRLGSLNNVSKIRDTGNSMACLGNQGTYQEGKDQKKQTCSETTAK